MRPAATPARPRFGLRFAVLCIGWVAAAAVPAAKFTADTVDWQRWAAPSFARAAAEDKLILLDVGIEGCTACRHMHEDTYTDGEVAALLAQHFIAISVDAEARPDLGERYSDWAWPAIVFMAPDGTQLRAIAGNKVPANFIPILESLIAAHQAGRLAPDPRRPYAAPAARVRDDLLALRAQVRSQLDRSFNRESGGWGRRVKHIEHAGPLLQLFLRAHAEGDRDAARRALQTAAGMRAMTDAVWGGIFIAALGRWDNTIAEKRTGSQAAALEVFAEAYQLTGEPEYRRALELVDRYLRDWMSAADGSFFTSQEDAAPGLPEDMDARDYYRIDSDAGRRAYGIPPIDHAVYTDLNARVINAYVRAFEATAERRYLERARRAAARLLAERLHPEGWLLQSVADDPAAGDARMRPKNTEERPYLKTQAYAGQALLALYRATAERRWLDTARRIAAALHARLEDPVLGGFYAAPPDGTDAIAARRKPLEDNAVAARFLYQLSVYAKEPAQAAAAERAIRASAAPEVLEREGKIIGNLALALEWITGRYVEFTVVGEPGTPQARELFEAARAIYEPRKILHFEPPGRYPDYGKATLFICNPDACSPPIFDVAAIDKHAEFFRGLRARRRDT